MYLNADPVVKAVLIGLAFASFVTWTVWLAKTVEIVFAKRRVRAALNALASVRSTSEGVERLADAQGEVRKFLDAAVTDPRIVRSSGVALLDEEALALLQRAQPFPPPPAREFPGERVSLSAPIRLLPPGASSDAKR